MQIIKGFQIVGLCLSCCISYAATLISWTIKNQPQSASVCFITDKPVYPHIFSLTHPYRTVVDFEALHLLKRLPVSTTEKGLITHVRTGHPNSKTLRFVFEMQKNIRLQPASRMLARGSQEKCLQWGTQGPRTDVSPVAHVYVQQVLKTPPKPLRDVVVVLDPGHGGKDPGAIGPHFSVEKNIVLAIAKRLKQKIDRQPGMHAVLTRNGDHYIGLRERLHIARKYNADIFVAIHADAFGNHESNGASVFALSPTGATSEAARWLAEKENYSELGGVNLADLDDQNGLVRTVLIDLSQTATIGASLQMGSRVLQHLDKITRLHNHRVEQARFVVLKSPDIPSVLIETGFISNPREELNLTNPHYQDRLTTAIFSGLKGYFWDHPPHGTRVELMSNVNRRIVHAPAALPSRAASA